MRIGIFGGSFNPPHKMHQNIVLELLAKKYIDKVIIVPAGNQYQKCDLIDCVIRTHMLKIMFGDRENVEISDYELQYGATYTYQLLDHFQTVYPNDSIFFLCGSDNLNEFDTWRNYQHILKNYQLLVIQRNHDNVDALYEKYSDYKQSILFAQIPHLLLSSTEIREEIRKNHYSFLKSKMNRSVLTYIKENQLYQID